jgi:hypothetical protein
MEILKPMERNGIKMIIVDEDDKIIAQKLIH